VRGTGAIARRFAVLALPAALLPLPASAASAHPACHEIAVSPGFAKDRIAFCTQVLNTANGVALAVYKTSNGGRTWVRTPAKRLGWDPAAAFDTQPQMSATYARDHRLVVLTNSGLYATTDDGESFTIVDARMKAADLNTPLVYTGSPGSLAPVLGSSRGFGLAAGLSPARVDLATGAHLPVVGIVGDTTHGFVVPTAASPASPVLAASLDQPDPSKPAAQVSLWTCTDDLVCAEKRYTFPVGVTTSRFWQLPLAGHRSALVAFADHAGAFQGYVSTDAGKTFRRWTSLERLVAPAAKYGAPPFVSIASNPALPGRVYARIVGSPKGATWAKGAPPAEQLFRSDDGGTTWRRVGFQGAWAQRGVRGTLPWNRDAFGLTLDPAAFALGSDGRLLVPAARENDYGMVSGSETVYCSLDGGRSWYPLCPR
jgi:hypothetical protein